MDAKTLGDFIAGRRRELGLTQAQLAARLHLTDKAVSRWERGVGLPDLATLEPLAAALEVNLAELMTARRQPRPLVQDGRLQRVAGQPPVAVLGGVLRRARAAAPGKGRCGGRAPPVWGFLGRWRCSWCGCWR